VRGLFGSNALNEENKKRKYNHKIRHVLLEKCNSVKANYKVLK